MTSTLSRRSWLQRTAMAAAVLPVSAWYDPDRHDRKYYPASQLSGEGAIRLNSNENAYGPSEAARAAITASLAEANRYPRMFISQLKEEIAKREGLSTDHVLITAGSTEILGLAGLAFGMHGGELLAFHPTFDFLMEYALRLGANWARTPLDENYQQDLDGLAKLAGKNTRLIFICNPNNPTGIELPAHVLRDFCIAHAGKYPVYVDEAYIELSSAGKSSSMASLVDVHPKLIISRTFSKVFGLAGMRIGYALAHPDMIRSLANLHTGRELTLTASSGAAALACLRDPGFESFSREKILEGRRMVERAFGEWGVSYLPSAANFIFFKNERFTSDPVSALAGENIFLRSYDYVPGWTRVSVGTIREMEKFIDAARKHLT